MKHYLYLLISIIILGIGSLFVFKKPDGTAWLNTSNFYNKHKLTNQLQQIKSTVSNKVNGVFEKTESTQIYKWQDETGTWHYSDKRENAKSGQKIENATTWNKPDNLTVIPTIKVNNVKDSLQKSIDKNSKEKLKHKESNLMPDRINTLIKDTHNIQNLMDNRTNKIDAML